MFTMILLAGTCGTEPGSQYRIENRSSQRFQVVNRAATCAPAATPVRTLPGYELRADGFYWPTAPEVAAPRPFASAGVQSPAAVTRAPAAGSTTWTPEFSAAPARFGARTYTLTAGSGGTTSGCAGGNCPTVRR